MTELCLRKLEVMLRGGNGGYDLVVSEKIRGYIIGEGMGILLSYV